MSVFAVQVFVLAAHVTVEPVRALSGAEDADHSTAGIVPAAVSLPTTPFPVGRATPRWTRVRPVPAPTPSKPRCAPRGMSAAHLSMRAAI
ncbi:hypothetical protein [Saccharothrix yanglingensis]|uniref:hypothetical protein n=1 Tax=Saccharothrix yanglingensis TaxID=659496 RepID=UPI0027D30570|nr:hypothetical protein [Saccharothrix yanglingensis]